MVSPRRLVFVGAHPDDESFGLGGTLGLYAAHGVQTAYVCATRGEAGMADAEHLAGFTEPGDMRWAELECAAQALGLTELVHLGYRDSGMPGSADNAHPGSLVSAPLEEVTERVVAFLRRWQPQVVITFDAIGGYRHPDHIHIHQATVAAFHAAGDPAQFPAAGPAYRPQKLYYQIFSRAFLKMAVRVLPVFGRDPGRFGRNGDIDLRSLTNVDFPVHAVIDIRGEGLRRKELASACHKSQLAGGPTASGLMGVVMRLAQGREAFMRAYPPMPNGGPRETDLFAGI